MGLLKETMQAIIRIDRNLAEIRKELAFERDAKYFRAVYQQKPIEQVRSDEQRKTEIEESLFDRLSQLDRFPHPDHLTFGGRLKAVRAFWRLKQDELASEIGVSPPHISNLEADKSTPSAMLIRSVSRRFSINETWLATGHLPQTTEEPATPIHLGKIVPLSGYGEKDAEQETCDAISQRLRLIGEEEDLNRQGRVRCSRYPSHCTQATPEQQKS